MGREQVLGERKGEKRRTGYLLAPKRDAVTEKIDMQTWWCFIRGATNGSVGRIVHDSSIYVGALMGEEATINISEGEKLSGPTLPLSTEFSKPMNWRV